VTGRGFEGNRDELETREAQTISFLKRVTLKGGAHGECPFPSAFFDIFFEKDIRYRVKQTFRLH